MPPNSSGFAEDLDPHNNSDATALPQQPHSDETGTATPLEVSRALGSATDLVTLGSIENKSLPALRIEAVPTRELPNSRSDPKENKTDIAFSAKAAPHESQELDQSRIADEAISRDTVNAKFTFDVHGRINSITYPDGKRVRTFGYEGTGNVVNRVVLTDKDKGTKVYTKARADQWVVSGEDGKKLGAWRGHVQLAEDGTYSVKPGRKEIDGTSDHWKTFLTDGTEVRVYRGEDGSRAIYDTTGRLQTISRSDGSHVRAVYEDGKLKQINESGANGEEEVWRKQEGSLWTCDAPKRANQPRKNVTFSKQGEILFLDAVEQKHTIKTNGLDEIKKSDRSYVECDRDGVVWRTHTSNGDYRTFQYDAHGNVSTITSVTKSGGQHLWQRKHDDKVSVTKYGDIEFRHHNGALAVERSTFQRVEFTACGRPKKITNANGSTREFTWDGTTCVAIIDSGRNDNGENTTRVWQLRGHDYVSEDQSGTAQIWTSATINHYGDLEYGVVVPFEITIPAGWQEIKQNSQAFQDFATRIFCPPNSKTARIVQWDRSELPISDEDANCFRDFLTTDPKVELKGERNEQALAAVLGNGILNNDGRFETVSLHTQNINGKRVLILEAKWTEAPEPMKSIGFFADINGDYKSIQQVWFIAPTDRSFNNGEYQRYLAAALQSMESVIWKRN